MDTTTGTPRSEPWPGWAKAMWSGCMAAMGGTDGMRQMMDGVRTPMR